MRLASDDTGSSATKTGLWLVLLSAASILTTFALACMTPAAAFAALAALYMGRNQGMLLMVLVWAASQVVGFGFMHYPLTTGTFVWGAALLICALATMECAALGAAQGGRSPVLRAVLALGAAMVAFKIAIYLFGMVLGGNEGAFSGAIVFKYVWTNAASFVFLLALHRAGVAIGLVARSGGAKAVSA